MKLEFITPDWPAPDNVKALSTTRQGGVSRAPYDGLNLGAHVGDDAHAVAANRDILRAHLPAEPMWLEQVHGDQVIEHRVAATPPRADAAYSHAAGEVCAILTADCLPVLFCDRRGGSVAAAHAGWRGLEAGVLENTVRALRVPPGELLAWLGPAIGVGAFEVGDEVRDAFLRRDPEAHRAFRAGVAAGKWMADLPMLARQRLARAGVNSVFGGDRCTFDDASRFFSYRRDRRCGRQASLIWLETR